LLGRFQIIEDAISLMKYDLVFTRSSRLMGYHLSS
jgi:hypothetical protein